MSKARCAFCGGRPVASRRGLSYRGFPLGTFKVSICCDCGEIEYDHSAWQAMLKIDAVLTAGSRALTSANASAISVFATVPEVGDLTPPSFIGEAVFAIAGATIPAATELGRAKLVTLPVSG